ncbi:MAG TPA: BMP family ABC transporter substrate-binding protein [Gaiellaceae bacterium]|nr:BMP family ABC transporter substrate-binding protein [Gaiellaceae bacterium]
MRVLRRTIYVLAVGAVVAFAAGCGGSSNKSSGTTQTSTTGGGNNSSTLVALISDIGKFNDRSFNQSQKEGLDRAKAELGIQTAELQSNSTSDYVPNLTQAVRKKADLIIAAGFLLADATNTVAKANPKLHFAITDYDVKGTPFNGRKNVMGLTYAANESGCLVGYLAAEMAKKQGGKQIIGAVGGLKIPPVDIWIAGYQYCAKLFNPKIKVLIGYSQDFVASDKCKTVAENQISQGAQVLFQVAGGCGLGTLKAADEAGIWGIGVDKDQYNDAKRVLTSGVKRVDNGVFDAAKQVTQGKFKGGGNLVFDLKNGGMDVGKINPAVPKAFIDKMNQLKQKIISGQVKVPASL